MKAPSTMPTMYVGSQSFELERVDYGAPEASGSLGGVQAGFPRWIASYFFSRMPIANSDEWRAWLTAQRGATRRFIAGDIARSLPRQYMETGSLPGGFDGECSGWSENLTADGDSEVTLNGLPVGLVMSQGDYIDYRYLATETAIEGLPWRFLQRVVEGGTVDGSGNVTVVAEPPISTVVPVDATAHIKDTGCIMALVLDQTSLEPVDRLYAVLGGTISAAQDIRA